MTASISVRRTCCAGQGEGIPKASFSHHRGLRNCSPQKARSWTACTLTSANSAARICSKTISRSLREGSPRRYPDRTTIANPSQSSDPDAPVLKLRFGGQIRSPFVAQAQRAPKRRSVPHRREGVWHAPPRVKTPCFRLVAVTKGRCVPLCHTALPLAPFAPILPHLHPSEPCRVRHELLTGAPPESCLMRSHDSLLNPIALASHWRSAVGFPGYPGSLGSAVSSWSQHLEPSANKSSLNGSSGCTRVRASGAILA